MRQVSGVRAEGFLDMGVRFRASLCTKGPKYLFGRGYGLCGLGE